MPIRKNKNGVWQIDFTTPSGERVRCSSKTTVKKLAQHLHDKLKHEAWQVEQLNKKPEKTVEQALILLLKDAEHKKDKLTKIQHAKYWRDEIGNKLLSSLTSEDIQNAIPTHVVRTGKILSPATQNRYRSSIMRAINLAKQAGWIDVVPYIAKNSEPKKRIRWITEKEAERLLDSLNLNWDKINFANKMAIVTGDIAKSGRGRSLPLSDDAINLIKERMKYQVSPYVFHSGTGKLRDDISRRDFKRALQRANIKNFRFHDLRHTWASWHIQRGTPLMVLKELGGWETIEMVQKYAHLNADHLLSYVNQVKFSSNTRLAR